MKRLWLILLVLGLITVFSVPALAVDVKFSGSYYAAGMYQDRTTTYKDTSIDGPSTAFYYQRLRVQTEFIVTPALKLVTRFDALERTWGAARSTPSATPDGIGAYSIYTSAGTTAENENIAFDLAYVQYASQIGVFTVGYQNDRTWGTIFGDSSIPRGKIGWSMEFGRWTVLAQIVKISENSYTAKNPSHWADVDGNKYIAATIYKWNSGEAGLLYSYTRDAYTKLWDFLTQMHSLQPYVKTKIGPVTLQTELDYYWGKNKGEDGVPDVDLESINFFIDAVADFNMFYVGGTFAYLSGDDPKTTDKIEGGENILYYGDSTSGGIDWNPCLIMFNSERTYWAGFIGGYLNILAPMQNTLFGQIRGGVRPIAALDIMATVSYAKADKLPSYALDKERGWEVDLIATYKITNNLSYMLGGGYLFTGDFYKGTTTNDIANDFLIINKLTLTF
jgi:hypothetical protein